MFFGQNPAFYFRAPSAKAIPIHSMTFEEVLTDPIWTARFGRGSAATAPAGGCIDWQGADNGNGHAMYSGTPAYRSVLTYFRGPFNPRLYVHHECGNGMCVNPLHLTPMTREQHRRRHIGPSGRIKLADEDVAEIRRLGSEWANATLAEVFGVARSTISMVRRGLRR